MSDSLEAEFSEEFDRIEGEEEDEDLVEYMEANAKAEAGIKEVKSIASDELRGVQKHRIILEIECSPSEAARSPAKCIASLAEEAHTSFLRNLAINNRLNPDEKHLDGEMDRLVCTRLATIGYVCQSMEPVNLYLDKQLPMTLSSTGKSNLVLEPSQGFVSYPMELHNPDNLMTRDMLRIWQSLDETVLKNEFRRLENANGKGHQNLVHYKGVAAGVLERLPDKFGNFRMRAPIKGTCFSPIPAKVAEPLYDYMKKTIEAISKSFISPKDIGGRFEPKSGDWTNTSMISGDVATLSHNKKLQHNERILQRRNRIAVHLDIETLPISKIHELKGEE